MATAPPPVLTIAPGPRNAYTDPSTGLRYYESAWNGHRYRLPSVTTIRRIAGIPHGLHQWSLSKVIERAVVDHEQLTRILTRDRRPRERVLEKNRQAEAGRWLRAAATEERDAAAVLGTAVHDAAARALDLEECEPAVRPRLLQYRSWVAAAQPEILAAEFQCWNLTVGYAGTADLLVRFPSGGVWLVDLKTGKGTYAEHALQLTMYRHAEFVGDDGRVDEPLTSLLHQAAGMAVLHLADDHWEFRVIRDDGATWEAACGLLQFAAWLTAHPDIGDVTVASRRSA